MPSINLDDVRLHYELSGSGDPLLLIPGLGNICRNWDPIVPALAEHYCVIQIDNRGIGKSIAKRPARVIEDYASDCLELLDALQIDRAHIMGISFGGILAQNFAADHPTRTDHLVLISTTDSFHPYLRHIVGLLGVALRRFPMRLFFQTMELMGTAPEYFDEHETEIMQSIPLRCGDRSLRRAIANQLRCLSSADRASSNAKIQSPTLVLAGEFDALIPNCYGKQMAAGIKDSKYVMMPGCGHNPICEQPDALIELVLPFLAKGIHSTGDLQFIERSMSECHANNRDLAIAHNAKERV